MSFESWLKKHKKQQNPIGDLARDFIDSGCETIERSFEKYSPSHEAMETYKKARKNYILELSNDLHEELIKVMGSVDRDEPTIWQQSVDTLHNIQDILADMESYLDESWEHPCE